jgi:hypothetical protein
MGYFDSSRHAVWSLGCCPNGGIRIRDDGEPHLGEGQMFDYISPYEIRQLSKLQLSGSKQSLPSQQRIRFELLGLIKDGPDGIQLTPKGRRVAQVGCPPGEQSEFASDAEAERLRVLSRLLS